MFNTDSVNCIFGRRGSGKSTLCRKLQNFFPNCFIFDTLKEYNDENYIFTNYQDFSDFVIKSSEWAGFRCVIQFDIEDSLQSEFFEECIRLIYYRGDAHIVIEEVQNFANVYKLPYFLKQASLTGRHKNIGFTTTTQRIAEIHKSLLSQSHNIFAGVCDNPTDLQTLKQYGFPPDEVMTTENYTFLWKNDREITKIDNSLNFV